MESALPKISHFLNGNSIESSAFEAGQLQLVQQRPITYFNETDPLSTVILFGDNGLGLGEMIVDGAMKHHSGMGNWFNENFGNYGNGIDFGKTSAIARIASFPAASVPPNGGKGKAVATSSATCGEFNIKKRKAETPTVGAEEKPLEKKVKADMEKDSNTKDNGKNRATISDRQKEHSKENSKGSEVAKRDYIHVRARRGQATDSHSLAERVRREKISAKMKYLQNLVPGCNKIAGKAGMLDEIINYVQSLQRQVEFLSMKLAAISPGLDFSVECSLAKEMFLGCGHSIPTTGVSLLGQGASTCGLETGVDAVDITLRKAIGGNVCVPETGLASSCLNQIQHLVQDAEFQNLYNMDLQPGRSALFISDQQFTGFVEAGHVKLEEI